LHEPTLLRRESAKRVSGRTRTWKFQNPDRNTSTHCSAYTLSSAVWLCVVTSFSLLNPFLDDLEVSLSVSRAQRENPWENPHDH